MIRDISPGTIVDGRYTVISRVGSGGMADVWCAQDEQLGRKVALKLLHRRFAEDAEFVERFRREASSAAGLQHPNVVQVYDRGEWDGTYYIAMEYLEGRNLKQVIREDSPLPPARAIDLTIQILKAARFAHKRGIIHRDLKPHNVIVDAEDRAKVTDFGIARAGASDMTETGSIMGTAQYLSPEQAQGHAVAATSDLYAIGVVLYELLTGRVPFDADSAVTIALKHVSEEPVPPSAWNASVTPELEGIVLHALQKNPAMRFNDADEFIAALEGARSRLNAAAGQSTAAFAATDATAVLGGAAAGAAAGLGAAAAADALHDDPATGAYDTGGYPPVDPEDDEAARARRRRWIWIAVIAALVIGGGIAAYALTRADKVTVPDVVRKNEDAATTILENAGFQVDSRPTTSDRPVGEVIRQSPQPGEKVKKGSTVAITVSGGPGTVEVPITEGLTEKSAVNRLDKAHLVAAVSHQRSDTVAEGKVISSSPSNGIQVKVGSTVHLIVSNGKTQVVVPNLVGKSSQDAAQNSLQAVGLTLGTVTEQESTDKDPGTVLSQDPTPDTKVDKGSSVDIVVAKAGKVPVPDETGKDQAEALNDLQDLGFTVSFDEQAVTTVSDDGKVLSQNPKAGKKVDKGTRVTLTIGKFTPPQQGGDGTGTGTDTTGTGTRQ